MVASLSISERSRLDLNSNPCTFHEVITSIPGASGALRRIESRLCSLRVLPGPLQRLVAPRRFAAAVVSTCSFHYHPSLAALTTGTSQREPRVCLPPPRNSTLSSLFSPTLFFLLFFFLFFSLSNNNIPWIVLQFKKYLKVWKNSFEGRRVIVNE